MAVSKTANDQLARIKKNVSTAYMYFDENYKRYRQFRKYAVSYTHLTLPTKRIV